MFDNEGPDYAGQDYAGRACEYAGQSAESRGADKQVDCRAGQEGFCIKQFVVNQMLILLLLLKSQVACPRPLSLNLVALIAAVPFPIVLPDFGLQVCHVLLQFRRLRDYGLEVIAVAQVGFHLGDHQLCGFVVPVLCGLILSLHTQVGLLIVSTTAAFFSSAQSPSGFSLGLEVGILILAFPLLMFGHF
ncbi:hypothetical protein FGO68_gene13441 [Halteria grandinella]|uniref:Uncharacterized protein n=1 Tax=Halteria grandinella TaxID=5974 RepID=A0A8J8NVL3_HALGN|nr:hypothetical protein FGO68_gene13441 [Halteria grandinella]